MNTVSIRRLSSADRDAARQLIEMMARAFEEELPTCDSGYLDALLARPDFWAVGA